MKLNRAYQYAMHIQQSYAYILQAMSRFFVRLPAAVQFLIGWIIATPFCAYCKQYTYTQQIFCDTCRLLIRPIVSVDLQVTATKHIKVLAIADYQEPLKSLILSKGHSNIAACRQLAELMWHNTYVQNVAFDIIVPIPLHWLRYAKRGYNQAHEMTKIIGAKSNKEVVNLLRRHRKTVFQSLLTHDKRADNVKQAFSLRITHNQMKYYAGKHLLLVDDLMTTGATLRNAVKVLLPLRPASITAVVTCRVV